MFECLICQLNVNGEMPFDYIELSDGMTRCFLQKFYSTVPQKKNIHVTIFLTG